MPVIDPSLVKWDSPAQAEGIDHSSIQWDDAPKSKRGTATVGESLYRGAIANPLDAGVEILYKALPAPVTESLDKLNNYLADKTGLFDRVPDQGGTLQYIKNNQQDYAERAPEGTDWGVLAGSVASPMNFVPGAALGKLNTLRKAALAGGLSGVLSSPVGDKDFLTGKLEQFLAGASGGVLANKAGGALSRIAMPKSASNQSLDTLVSEGVKPTVGQILGGRWNAAEEKLSSVPVLGDAIVKARGRAVDEFNTAAINRAVAPIGERVSGTGHAAVAEAGDKLSAAYDKALSKIHGVQFDQNFQNDFSQISKMSSGLIPDMKAKFDATVSDLFLSRLSPNGSMRPEVYKKVDSELGAIASKWQKSTSAGESELGDAIAQLRSLMQQQMRRSNPQVAEELSRVDAGWANLVRIEKAAEYAKNNGGEFSPGQLGMAVRATDDSTRKRAVARGTALMQDLSNAGQQVLGNKVPNSGTVDRASVAGLAATLLSHPHVAAGLFAGPAIYSEAGQNALRAMLTKRPEFANKLSDLIRSTTPYGVAPAGAVGVNLVK